eukprot:TRINITY_DN726_c2_g1_i1.p1 TRINITY_DN726_c2_g1~~TRINITY_DN726_c2_g1_i1.p1  ORF type:complete len:197 (+),score=30.00 TRINITY_DN726_c2_g1_i1:62-652(+)
MQSIMDSLKAFVKSSLYTLGLSNKQGKLLFLGLDNAGKTTLLKRMLDGKLAAPRPTIHPNCGEIAIGSLNLKTFDLGGHENARMLWDQYYTMVDGIVFLIDTQDDERFALAKEQLDELLMDKQLDKVPMLILGNKIDLRGSCSRKTLVSALGIEDELQEVAKGEKTRPIRLEMCSVVNETGYGDGFRWLASTLQDA